MHALAPPLHTADCASTAHRSEVANGFAEPRNSASGPATEKVLRGSSLPFGMQAGCSALPDRDAALGRYPRPRPETLLGWLERLDRTQVHPVLGTPCWLWPGGLSGGYGHVTYRVGGEKVDAKLHVLLYEIFVGPVEPGLLLDHRCRRRPCCNPDCLEPVDNRTNVIRGVHGRRREEAVEAGQIELAVAA